MAKMTVKCNKCGTARDIESALFYAKSLRVNLDTATMNAKRPVAKCSCGGSYSTVNTKIKTHKKSVDRKRRSSMKG